MRRAAKVDVNQSTIVQALRQAGSSVLLLHQVGKGCPDILAGSTRICPCCGYGLKYNYLLELKNPDMPASKQRLTEDEQAFFDSWRGQVSIVKTIEEALKLVGKIE